MTVASEVNHAQFDGNGATTVFPFNFRILNAAHLVVTVIDAAGTVSTLTLGTDYTISGVGAYAGGSITLTGGALPIGSTIALDRQIPITQETSIRNQGAYFPEIHEDAFDKLTMLIQEAFSWLTSRALLKPTWLSRYYDAKGNRIANLGEPVNAQDATTKNYVDTGIAAEALARSTEDALLQQELDAETVARINGDAYGLAFASRLFSDATHYLPSNNGVWYYGEAFGINASSTMSAAVDCSQAFSDAIDFMTVNGGTLMLPRGYINVGTLRKTINYSASLKQFSVVGNGTTIVFKNIDPPTIDTTTKNWGSETALFSIIGNSDEEYIPEILWIGVTFDYSDQANKGGNTLDTLGICHPTPYSTGCRAFFVRYALKPTFSRCTFQNIYGDGFWIRNCTQPLVENCTFFNVSANQLVGRLTSSMALDSSGGCVFFQSCYGGRITGNLCWNTREYAVDFASPDTGIQLNGTLCGYIGLWCEYALDGDSYPPPLVDWTTANAGVEPSLGAVIENNIVYGYCLGIKTEAKSDALIKGNVVRNCWKSILSSGTHATITGNWVNVTGGVAGKAPQGGFESSRGAISFGDATGQAPGTLLTNHGSVASENFIEVENTPVFSTSQDNVKFFNNHCSYAGTSNGTYSIFLVTDTARRHLTIENNYFIISSNAVPVTQNFTQCNGLIFRGNYLYNKSSTRWAFSILSGNLDVLFDNNQFIGPMSVSLAGVRGRYINNIHELDSNNIRMLTLSGVDCIAQGNTFYVNQATTESPIYLSANRVKFIDNNIVISSAASTNVTFIIYVTSGYTELQILRNKLIGNNGNQSLMRGNGMGNSIVSCNWTDSVSATLIQQSNICIPPMYCEGNTFGGGIVTGSDPNALSRLGNMAITPYIGMEVKYLLPAAAGYRGNVYTNSGWKTYGVISS